MSYMGSVGFGGQNWIKYPWDFVVIIVVSYLFYRWGIHSHLSKIEPVAIEVNKRVKNE